jgi:hypothetical protein
MNQSVIQSFNNYNTGKWEDSTIFFCSFNIFLFIFSPLLPLIFCLIWILLYGEKHIKLNIFLISLYATLIFSSRSVFQNNSDDFIRYYSLYLDSKENISAIYLFYGLEIFFPTFIYLVSNLKDDLTPNILLIILTLPSFCIFISGSYIFLKNIKNEYNISDIIFNFQLVLLFISILIYGGMFSQLLRSFYSLGFIIYAISIHSKNKKKNLFFLSIVSHLSAIFYIMIIYLEKILLIRKVLLIFYFILFLIVGYLSYVIFSKYFITYLVSTGDTFKIDKSIYYPFILTISISLILNNKLQGKRILIILLRFFIISILLLALFPNPTLMYRFLLPVIYFFSPFYLILNLNKFPKILYLSTTLLIFYLFYNIIIRTLTIDENQLGIGYSIFSFIPFKWFFTITNL